MIDDGAPAPTVGVLVEAIGVIAVMGAYKGSRSRSSSKRVRLSSSPHAGYRLLRESDPFNTPAHLAGTVEALWRIRVLFGIVAVWQCLQAHQVAIAVTTAVLMTASYSGPACARAWRRRVEAAADRCVAQAGLSDQLEFAVRSADEPGSIDRVERIRRAAKDAVAADQAAVATRQLYLVR